MASLQHRRVAAYRETVTVALVADPVVSERLRAGLGAGVATVYVGGSALAPTKRAYRRSALAIVAVPAAMPWAVGIQRLSRIPWLAALDEPTLVALESGSDRMRWVGGQAAALLVEPELAERARLLAPSRRTVAPDDSKQTQATLRDLALAGDARSGERRWAAALVDGWSFANDRATRLAMKLVRVTGKAPEPTHPQHLVPGKWHFWYLDELKREHRVLDIGCGDGSHTLAAASVARAAVGVDLDVDQLERARRRAQNEKADNVEFQRVDLSNPTSLGALGQGWFHVALALDVLEHLADRDAVLRQVRELLTPGGVLIAAVPNRDTPYKRLRRRLGAFAYADSDHKVEYTEQSFRAELERAGFTAVSVQRGGYDSPFAGFSTLLAPISLRAFARLSAHRSRLSQVHPDRATAFRVVARRTDAEPSLRATP